MARKSAAKTTVPVQVTPLNAMNMLAAAIAEPAAPAHPEMRTSLLDLSDALRQASIQASRCAAEYASQMTPVACAVPMPKELEDVTMDGVSIAPQLCYSKHRATKYRVLDYAATFSNIAQCDVMKMRNSIRNFVAKHPDMARVSSTIRTKDDQGRYSARPRSNEDFCQLASHLGRKYPRIALMCAQNPHFFPAVSRTPSPEPASM